MAGDGQKLPIKMLNDRLLVKLSKEDGRIEVEFEVDQNRNGVRWHVVLLRNGVRVAGRTTLSLPKVCVALRSGLSSSQTATGPAGAPATFSMRAVMSVFALRLSTFRKYRRAFGS